MTPVTVSIVSVNEVTAAATVAVVALFGFALRRRSWTWWLTGYAATLLTLVLAWSDR
jgi:hypothetical protein